MVFTGKLQPWVSGKDVVLALLARWGQKQAQGMSVEFVDADKQLPMSYRNTIANMMAEGEAQNGIFAADELLPEMDRFGVDANLGISDVATMDQAAPRDRFFRRLRMMQIAETHRFRQRDAVPLAELVALVTGLSVLPWVLIGHGLRAAREESGA